MPKIFIILDKMKPFYDLADRITMFICKILLIIDIGVTSMAVAGRYISFIPDPAWSEEMVLTAMSYMAVLSAAIAIRHNRHIRMTAFDRWLPKNMVRSLDLLADFAVLGFGILMLTKGMEYALTLGARGFYTSIPTLSRFWNFFPVPLAGITMIIFEFETIVRHIRVFFEKDGDVKPLPVVPGLVITAEGELKNDDQ